MSNFVRGEQLYDDLTRYDLYDIDTGTYFFIYNEEGAIAYYRLNQSEIVKYAEEALDAGEGYIGAVLGRGGFIIDPDGSNFEEIYEFLERYADDEIIKADPTYIVRYFR